MVLKWRPRVKFIKIIDQHHKKWGQTNRQNQNRQNIGRSPLNYWLTQEQHVYKPSSILYILKLVNSHRGRARSIKDNQYAKIHINQPETIKLIVIKLYFGYSTKNEIENHKIFDGHIVLRSIHKGGHKK